MQIMLKVNDGDIPSQLSDVPQTFKQQEIVIVGEQSYLFADYVGNKQLISDFDVDTFLTQRNEDATLKRVVIDNVSGQLMGYVNQDNEFTVPQQSNDVIATSQLAIPDSKFKIPFKRIDTGRIQLMPAQVVDGELSIPLKFETNGIWIVNKALFNADFSDAPFELPEYRFSVI
ncbi:hypothetical protein PSECIP111854_02052 [Pseudoalteromonas sp. CIP111854]|uniref:Uncharacterized protein n=1 Tax=Pseudoalteromonas holothuriae TaxID=2963714 RepID=A0A9W4QXH8_9GAMM|nr:hypothetical protein [Pseudoalteromonas sp. CIP111854]CAH9057711.1 hypothetical protein PSECIP111854_02052 [Pseudoalteromonas sp. CIP111854]